MKKETSAGAVLILNEKQLLNEALKKMNPIFLVRQKIKHFLSVQQGTARVEPKYLLLRHSAGHWDFPKGHVEHGETDETTTRREIEEETGIKDVKILPDFKEKIHYFFKQNKQLYSK